MIAVGEQAPGFILPSISEEREWSLAHQKGKFAILFFYPKDGTPGCTTEGCSIRDRYEELRSFNAVVVGISADSLQSHEQFARQNNFPFPLLSDEDLVVAGKYGVVKEKKFLGKLINVIERSTFVIDPEGVISDIFEQVDPLTHAQELVDTLRKHTVV